MYKVQKDYGASVSSLETYKSSISTDPQLEFWVVPRIGARYFINLAEFRDGPSAKSRAFLEGNFTGRPELISDLALVLRVTLAERALNSTRGVCKSLRMFWRFLDTLPAGVAPRRLADINDLLGGLWIRAGADVNSYRPVLSLLQVARKNANLTRLFWPETPQKELKQIDSVCQIGMRRLYHALKREAAEVLKHRATGETLAQLGSDPGPVGTPGWASLENQSWILRHQLPYLIPIDYNALGTSSPYQRSRIGRIFGKDLGPVFSKVAWFYPSRVQTSLFYLLFTMQAGWNQDTVNNLDVTTKDAWLTDHPVQKNLGILKAVKKRPTESRLRSHCVRHNFI